MCHGGDRESPLHHQRATRGTPRGFYCARRIHLWPQHGRPLAWSSLWGDHGRRLSSWSRRRVSRCFLRHVRQQLAVNGLCHSILFTMVRCERSTTRRKKRIRGHVYVCVIRVGSGKVTLLPCFMCALYNNNVAGGQGVSGALGQLQSFARSITRLVFGILYVLNVFGIHGSTVSHGPLEGTLSMVVKGIDICLRVCRALLLAQGQLFTLFLLRNFARGLRMRVMTCHLRVTVLLHARSITHSTSFGIARNGLGTKTRFNVFPCYQGSSIHCFQRFLTALGHRVYQHSTYTSTSSSTCLVGLYGPRPINILSGRHVTVQGVSTHLGSNNTGRCICITLGRIAPSFERLLLTRSTIHRNCADQQRRFLCLDHHTFS